MISREKIERFQPELAALYRRQEQISYRELRGAADELDCYSCHSLPHIEEVMEQCDALFHDLAPWLRAAVPGADPDWMYAHLMLGAKYHDVGMSGTDAQFALLGAVDDLQIWLGGRPLSPSRFQQRCDAVCRMAAEAGIDSRALRDFAYWCARSDAQERLPRLRRALTDAHDDIKREMRVRHALISGRYVLSHMEELRAAYREGVNWPCVALLAAMHSDMSAVCTRVAWAGEDAARLREYAVELLAPWIGEERARRYAEGGVLERIVPLAAVLRLADTRRDGARLRALDGQPLRCGLSGRGDVLLRKGEGGAARQIPVQLAFEILAAEASTRFGPVRATNLGGGRWRIEHEITLVHAENPELRRMFVSRRLASYAGELRTGAMAAELGFEHVLAIRLEGCGAEERGRILAAWNEVGIDGVAAIRDGREGEA